MSRRHSSWVLLPAALTLGNALCGFLALRQLSLAGTSAARAAAGWWMLAGWIFDLLDGPAARWTGAIGAFGGQMDALSDVLTFGAAAALLLASSGAPGAAVTGALLLCAVILRLARFAAETDDSGHLWFAGLPSPASAALVASIALCDAAFPGWIPSAAWPAVAIALALLMVSRIPYPDLPKHVSRGLIPRWTVVPVLGLFAWQPRLLLLAGWLLYATTPPLIAAWSRATARRPAFPPEPLL